MQRIVVINVLAVVVALLLKACASVSSPSGGKKDETPPQLVRTIPEEKSRSFKGKTLELVFDEFIQIENLKQELLITPDIQGNYEFKPIKNGFRLVFDKPFLDSTTYTFNFRNAIKDVTEKNIAENTKLVFSTGAQLDTLSVRGRVTDLLSGKPVENAVISLYRTNDTLDILKHKPFYFTKTDKEGNYLLENLRQDNYRVYALQDRNNNLRYDAQTAQNESIAFRAEPIALDSSYSKVDFALSRMDAIAPKISGRNASTGFFELEFDEGLQSAAVRFGNAADNAFFNLIEKGKKVRIYNTVNRKDSIPVQVSAVDSLGNTLEQNVRIKFDEVTAKNRAPQKEKFESKTDPAEGEKVLRDFVYEIQFSKPIATADLSQVQLLADTVTLVPLDPVRDLVWNPYRTSLKVNKKLEVRKAVRVSIPKGAFLSVEGDTASQVKTTHELKDPENYGSIAGRITASAPNVIIQLLNSGTLEVTAEVRNQYTYKFSYLDAGDYLIRVIIDRNNNGRWDQGNFADRRQPEDVFFGPNVIKLKENWELTDQNVSL
jgi:5-hydroxyisourate hydrolase-like protein (transthyretin family)